MWGFEVGVMLAMIAVNGVFAAYELALASTTLGRLHRLAQERRRGARIALYMKRNVEASLAVVQLGITLVGAIAAAVGGAGAEESLAPALVQRFGMSERLAEVSAIALVVAPLTAVMIVFGELIPKVFALRNSEWVCLTLSPVMRAFSLTVWPAVWLFETIVSAIVGLSERLWRGEGRAVSERPELRDLHATAALARASRLIGRREERIIVSATELRARAVSDVMLPVEQVSLLAAGDSVEAGLRAAARDLHTRYPVALRPEAPTDIVGYVNVKDLVIASHDPASAARVGDIARPIPSVAADRAVAECLEMLMSERSHLALVLDAGGVMVGLVTLEDIVELLVGDIDSEFADRRPSSPPGGAGQEDTG